MNTFVCPRGCDVVVRGLGKTAAHECPRPYKAGDGTYSLRVMCDRRECALIMERLDVETRSVPAYDVIEDAGERSKQLVS